MDKGLQYYEERHRDQQVQLLKKRAATLGLQIVEPELLDFSRDGFWRAPKATTEGGG